jgi:hypothetical protein
MCGLSMDNSAQFAPGQCPKGGASSYSPSYRTDVFWETLLPRSSTYCVPEIGAMATATLHIYPVPQHLVEGSYAYGTVDGMSGALR